MPRTSKSEDTLRRKSRVASANSITPDRLTSIINLHRNMPSFVVSPAPSRLSVLSDDTDIEEPRRSSWWRKLDDRMPHTSKSKDTLRRKSRVASANSITPDRLTSIINLHRNMSSFVVSPAPSRLSVLSDNTDIEEPRRSSWWRKLDDDPRDIMEVVKCNKDLEPNNILEELDIEVLSPEQKSQYLDLPENSNNESIASIVIPQRQLLNRKENQPPKKFHELINSRESMKKNNMTIDNDKASNVGVKELFQNKSRLKPVLSSALLNLTNNKTLDAFKEPELLKKSVKSKNRFAPQGSDSGNLSIDKSVFENSKETSKRHPSKIIFNSQSKRNKIFSDIIASESGNLSVSETNVKNKSKSAVTNQLKNIFSNQNEPRTKNRFSKFIGTDSENELEDIQPNRVKSIGLSLSPTSSYTTDIEMDEWAQLPSSTMMEHQIQDALETPLKKSNFQSKSHVTNTNASDFNKATPSDKSNSSKNRSQHLQDSVRKNSMNQALNLSQITRSKSKMSILEDKDTTLTAENDVSMNIKNHNVDSPNSTLVTQHKNTSKQPSFTQTHLHESFKTLNNSKQKPSEISKIEDRNTTKAADDADTSSISNHTEETHKNNNLLNNSNLLNVTSKKEKDNSNEQSEDDDVEIKNGDNLNNNPTNGYNNEGSKNIETSNCERIETDNNHADNVNTNMAEGNNSKEYNDFDNNNENKTQSMNIDVDMEENDNKQDFNNSEGEEVDENSNKQKEGVDSENDDVNESAVDEENINESDVDDHLIQSDVNNDKNESVVDNDGGVNKSVVDNDTPTDENDDDDIDAVSNDDEENLSAIDAESNDDAGNDDNAFDNSSNDNVTTDGDNAKAFISESDDNDVSMGNDESDTQGSPEAILRNNNLNSQPSMAPPRESTGISDGTGVSSVEGSGWDSHRTTRKTLRQTFGRDFSPRKSLRALVMEKSAKRQTNFNMTEKSPQTNSTEFPQTMMTEEELNVSDETREIRKAEIEMKVNKHVQELKDTLFKISEAAISSLNKIKKEPYNPFKVPQKPSFATKEKKIAKKKVRKQYNYVIPGNALPLDFKKDLKYKPKRNIPRNASWATKRLYTFLENKLKPHYSYRARIRAERVVEDLHEFVKNLRKAPLAPVEAVKELKYELARLEIVRTHYDFYTFFREYMPKEIRYKVIPDIINNLPLPRNIYDDIMDEDK